MAMPIPVEVVRVFEFSRSEVWINERTGAAYYRLPADAFMSVASDESDVVDTGKASEIRAYRERQRLEQGRE